MTTPRKPNPRNLDSDPSIGWTDADWAEFEGKAAQRVENIRQELLVCVRDGKPFPAHLQSTWRHYFDL